MHKFSNITGALSTRHGVEKMTPAVGYGPQRQQSDTSFPPSSIKRSVGANGLPSSSASTSQLNLSFNVPFSSNLAGPEKEDTIHASPGSFGLWTHSEDSEEPIPNHKLPVHARNVENLRAMCRQMTDSSDGRLVATVTSSEPRPIPGLQLGPLRSLVTNVCLSGDAELVRRMRGRILNDTPISLRCATVDIDQNLISDPTSNGIRASVLEHLNDIASFTRADVFLLKPKQIDIETASFNGTLDNSLDQRYRIAIYGDLESSEHAKTRLLIMIDQILKRKVDIYKLELSLHTMICGRLRRHIKIIESATNTAIYFPPPFPQIYGFVPKGAHRRREDEIFITGENENDIYRAKTKLHELARNTTAVVKEVRVSSDKVDSILLERLDKIRKIIEYNGSYVLFPQLGVQRGIVRFQGTDMLHVERTIREVMSICGQFYSASWWITMNDQSQRGPTPSDVRSMLADICISSGAEIHFEKLTFHIFGSDDAVKAALWIINTLPFVKKAQSHLRIKIELANEHKEFVSGKKNGKINKIMNSSNVQVYFDLFNEYNFFIDVSGPSYEATKNGLELVEQEMPASIAFHVPDQYHKRIIGIGGQHIQRIMKKYSVFVKFSNAMDRGGITKDDDDIKVDNVICRTPSRNAQSLDLVKQEIMDMVEKVDAEFISEHVVVNRLYLRELLGRMSELEELEKKWNCKLTFPSTEQASDIVTITGPEIQVPKAVNEFLGMVPESHEISFQASSRLAEYLKSQEFSAEVVEKLKSQYEVDLHLNPPNPPASDAEEFSSTESLNMSFTRNNAGGLKDAIDFVTSCLVPHGLDASTVRGAIPRPKSDSFEDSLPFFDSKLVLPRSTEQLPLVTDSPTRSIFGDDGVNEQRSFFDKLRKPGSISSFSSFLERRRNGSNSPGSFMKHASSNASKASLNSLESRDSSHRNPWNDSGVSVNLPEDEHHGGWPATTRFGEHKVSLSNAFYRASTSSVNLNTPLKAPSSGLAGDATPKYDPSRASHDSGRPSTSASATSGHPGPIGPPQ